MTRISADEFSAGRPKLTPEDLDGPSAVLVVAAAEAIEVEDDATPDGKRKCLILRFEQTGDRVLYLNKTMIDTMLGQFGPETDDWLGQHIPVQRHTAEFRGKRYHKLRVAPAEEWGDLLPSTSKSRPSKRPTSPAPRARSGQRK